MRGLKPSTIVPGSSPVETVPRPPSYLSKDAKAEWRRVAPILSDERKVLTLADLAALENYVIAVATMQQAHRELQATGLLIAGKRNPVSTILLQAQQQQLRAAGELGLTPSARSRANMIGSDDDDDDNPLTIGRNRR
ncbi:phage terminase small subunit P27 family [Bosea sp. (in: a-proteobacteria)]|uniref:phage terminase small subunit P27 family n=1 Tax=Bosea sp. (in: a-proteobacteria) TaxID=1871050 RepID=UPI001ACD1D94|nr:phage terminase small subunit P27 family [Bosea sp. (in: a-proteobacteria)]MBN9437034.1 phage terminase small subunit P27 family [Bosea sp. (in: a-proteobacteria)]